MEDKKLNKKKILCVSVMQTWGGGEEFLLKLTEYLPDYDFVVVSPEGSVLDKYKEKGLRTKTISSLKKIYRNSKWNLNSLFRIINNIIPSTFKLLKTFKSEKPSIVLTNGLFAALYVLPSIFVSGKKLVVVQHLIYDKNSMEKKVVGFVFRYAEKVICVSGSVKENLLLMLSKKDSDKIIVIPNGIVLPAKKISNKEFVKEIKIGIIGSIIRLKGIHLIIESLKDILEIYNVQLYIFGTTANNEDSRKYKEELVQMVNNSDLKEKIHFEGYVESKNKIYTSVDIVINYSLIPESFSFTVLEAMAYKKIVIAANEGGPKEIITDGETGFLVEPQNVKLLKDKVLFCINNFSSTIFYNIREKAFIKVKNNYSIEIFTSNYKKLFELLTK